jgi:hypothetical protein
MEELEKKQKSDAQESAEAVGGMLEAVGDKVPRLIKNVMNSLYSQEVGAGMGKAVGAYYRELIEAGIPQEAALEMAKGFSFSLKDMNFQGQGQRNRKRGDGKGFTFRYGADGEEE